MRASAYHLGVKLDISSTQQIMGSEPIKKENSFLLFDLSDDSYIYFKNFGAIVFINCKEEYEKEVIDSLQFDRKSDFFLTETFQIEVQVDSQVKVDYTTIYIPFLTHDIAHIICLNLAETVVLDHFQQTSEGLLSKINNITRDLSNYGRITIGRKRMRKFIGRTLYLRNQIVDTLYIFESPDLVWDDELLASIDKKMRDQLEIIDRHHSLEHNLNTIKENLDYFKDILQHRHSSILEWVIILLIFIEIIHLITDKIL